MILKGSQRANGADLAIHLQNAFDNDHVEIAQVYGTIADDLFGAFAEFEAVASGTRAKQPLYSLSINPSAPLTRAQYAECIATIEQRLGLSAQPRAIVFHVKDGREHCHVIWSRIDVAKMRAISMSHDHRKLCDLACELARKYGLELPPGLRAWEAKQQHRRDHLEATLAERAHEQASGITPEQRRAEVSAAWEQADSAQAFVHALEERGYILAKGDRRAFVIIDQFGDVHSLTRYIKGERAKAVMAKLAALDAASLPSAEAAQDMARARMAAWEELRSEQERKAADERRRVAVNDLTGNQRARRAKVAGREQDLAVRHAAENMALHAAQDTERRSVLYRVRRAVAEFIDRTPGLRSVLGPIQKMAGLDPAGRHRLEREALARRHERERRGFERHKRALSRLETRERQSLEKRLRQQEAQGRAAALKAAQDRSQEEAAAAALEQARQEMLVRESYRAPAWGELSDQFNRGVEEDADLDREPGALSDEFNAHSGIGDAPPSADGEDGDDDGPRHRPNTPRRRRRGKGYGYRRDE